MWEKEYNLMVSAFKIMILLLFGFQCHQNNLLTIWSNVDFERRISLVKLLACLMAQLVKRLSAMWETQPGSIPGLGRYPGEGNDNPLQYSCLKNSMDGGAW